MEIVMKMTLTKLNELKKLLVLLENPISNEDKIAAVKTQIEMYSNLMMQFQLQENLNRQEVKAGDDEQVSDSMEKPVDWSNYED